MSPDLSLAYYHIPHQRQRKQTRRIIPKQDLEVGWVGKVVVKGGLAQSGHWQGYLRQMYTS